MEWKVDVANINETSINLFKIFSKNLLNLSRFFSEVSSIAPWFCNFFVHYTALAVCLYAF